MNDKCMIIAEAGVNHNGNLDLALKLCDAAKNTGADVVKFQTWITDRIITKTVEQADYQKKNMGVNESQYDMLKKLELPFEDFRIIKKHCDEIGILFASTADEEESLDFLIDLGIPFIKIGSGDIGNVSFLRYIGGKKLPVILSTGMSGLGDVELSIQSLRNGGAQDISLLHCTTNYPCSYEEVNLRAMMTLRDAFHLPVGYSDHTIGTEVAVGAVALGAKVIEKHFTLDRSMEGPDHLASTEPEDFRRLVNQVRNIEVALGNAIKKPSKSEASIRQVITKRIVASRPIGSGEVFSAENLCIKRSEDGEEAKYWDEIVGGIAQRSYQTDEGIRRY